MEFKRYEKKVHVWAVKSPVAFFYGGVRYDEGAYVMVDQYGTLTPMPGVVFEELYPTPSPIGVAVISDGSVVEN